MIDNFERRHSMEDKLRWKRTLDERQTSHISFITYRISIGIKIKRCKRNKKNIRKEKQLILDFYRYFVLVYLHHFFRVQDFNLYILNSTTIAKSKENC